jgi:hypothetical protein
MQRLHDPVQAPVPGVSCGPDRATRILERFRDERQRLIRRLVPAPAAAILAARNAGTMATTAAAGLPLDAALPSALWPFAALTGTLPAPDLLGRCALALCGAAPGPQETAAVTRGWELAEAAESLLAGGGDERLSLDPATGLNRYGCAPHPRPGVVAFSSCTASSVSATGLAAAEAARRDLLEDALHAGHRVALDAGFAAATSRILDHYGARGLATALIVPSGTDAALLATAIVVARLQTRPEPVSDPGRLDAPTITSVLVDPGETGSGVPAAARGQHFATITAAGEAVTRGEPVAGCPAGIGVETVALREPSGLPRAPDQVHDAFERVLERCCAVGHVILHRADCSKTGLSVPGTEACLRWSERFGDRLTIIVDASQARLVADEVRRSLDAGWPVILTGSKFFGGPGFCGVLLLPAAQAGAITAGTPLMPGLRAYAAGLPSNPERAEWHAGLLLRWIVSLREMDSFRRCDAAKVEARLREHGRRIATHIRADPRLSLVPAGGSAPDSLAARSIVTFTVRAPHAARLMRLDELALVHLWLDRDLDEAFHPAAMSWTSGTAHRKHVAASRCRIGQPVRLGHDPDEPFGGLRLALDAAQLQEDDGGAALSLVFAKLALVLDHFDALSAPDRPAAE